MPNNKTIIWLLTISHFFCCPSIFWERRNVSMFLDSDIKLSIFVVSYQSDYLHIFFIFFRCLVKLSFLVPTWDNFNEIFLYRLKCLMFFLQLEVLLSLLNWSITEGLALGLQNSWTIPSSLTFLPACSLRYVLSFFYSSHHICLMPWFSLWWWWTHPSGTITTTKPYLFCNLYHAWCFITRTEKKLIHCYSGMQVFH